MGERGERHDDTEEALLTRLAEYREKTLPVIDVYQEKGLLIDIDSTQSKETVLETIIDELYKRATQA